MCISLKENLSVKSMTNHKLNNKTIIIINKEVIPHLIITLKEEILNWVQISIVTIHNNYHLKVMFLMKSKR